MKRLLLIIAGALAIGIVNGVAWTVAYAPAATPSWVHLVGGTLGAAWAVVALGATS